MLELRSEGMALATDPPSHAPRTFEAALRHDVYCSLDQAKSSIDDDGVVFWDTRSLGEFDGKKRGWNSPPRLGHLPGAVHLEWAELFDAGGMLKPAAELNTLLATAGITPESSVAAY